MVTTPRNQPIKQPPRKVIHIDMDAYYAAIEQRDFPQYRGKPLIVGGAPDKRGVVAACSYEARRFGIHSAMPSATAHRLCPEAIFVRPRFDVYRATSRRIQHIFRRYTYLVEPLSLDEAYLEVTDSPLFSGSASLIAKDIKARIKQTTGLTASAGVSYNKFLAKVASDMDKPDGLFVIAPEQGSAFIEQLPVNKFFGVGKVTAAKMKALGIHTGADLKQFSLEELTSDFGKIGIFFHSIALGVDDRPVNTNRQRKSVGSETTFEHDLSDPGEILARLQALTAKVADRLTDIQVNARTLTIKIKYDNFEQITRSKTLPAPLTSDSDMVVLLPEMLSKTEVGRRKVRLLGITTSNLVDARQDMTGEQLLLL